MLRLTFICTAFIFTLGACAHNEPKTDTTKAAAPGAPVDFSQYGRQLNHDEIVKLLPDGAVLKGKNQYKTMGVMWEWECVYTKDGMAHCKAGPYKDSGPWTVEDNKFCQKFNAFNGGKKKCNYVREKDGTYAGYTDTRLEDLFWVKK